MSRWRSANREWYAPRKPYKGHMGSLALSYVQGQVNTSLKLDRKTGRAEVVCAHA
ncbi:hypothetical protein UNDKW_3895 [Undibacterium sp. KW1]|nr:hypothetical protein UNDKW_3895 [Undibacterium sp. KW1]